MTLWMKAPIILAVFAILLLAIVLIGEYLRQFERAALIEKFINKSPTEKLLKVDYESLKDLPMPVQRYFQNVLTNGQSFIKTSWLEQNGKLKISPKSADWSAFKASQIISQDTVSFLWDAKINIAPLFYVRVRDSLIGGFGAGKVYMMSVLPIGSDENTLELNSGALYRYLAEAVWYPTALLPQSGIIWESVDEKRL